MGQSKAAGRLKLAEQLIKQRSSVTERTINEFEHVEINKLRTELMEELKVNELRQKAAELYTERNTVSSQAYTKQQEGFRVIREKQAPELQEAQEAYNKDLAELNNKFSAKKAKIAEKYADQTAKVTEDYNKATTKIHEELTAAQHKQQEAERLVEDKLRERSLEIKQKAAQMRTQLAHDVQSAIDKIYEAELSPELKATVDSLPTLEALNDNSPRLTFKKQS